MATIVPQSNPLSKKSWFEVFVKWLYAVVVFAKKLNLWLVPAFLTVCFMTACAHRLKNDATGVDPAGGQQGGLRVLFVNPPYRAQDKFSITGQSPAPRPYPQRSSGSSHHSSREASHRFPK